MSIRLKGHATEGSVSEDLGILSLLIHPSPTRSLYGMLLVVRDDRRRRVIPRRRGTLAYR